MATEEHCTREAPTLRRITLLLDEREAELLAALTRAHNEGFAAYCEQHGLSRVDVSQEAYAGTLLHMSLFREATKTTQEREG